MNLLKTISFIALIISSNSYAAQSYELGLGTNYGGVVGVTINTEINSNVEMFAGLGLGYEALGYVVGSKFWLNENVRLTANYGINCVVSSPWRDYYGLNFGAGGSVDRLVPRGTLVQIVTRLRRVNLNENISADRAA